MGEIQPFSAPAWAQSRKAVILSLDVNPTCTMKKRLSEKHMLVKSNVAGLESSSAQIGWNSPRVRDDSYAPKSRSQVTKLVL